MSWLLRFLAWASVLFPVCYVSMNVYQAALARLASALLAGMGFAIQFERLDVHEPTSLGLFAAMCLASRRAPNRVRALAIGTPALAALNLTMLVAGVAGSEILSRSAGVPVGSAAPAMSLVIDTTQWVAAPALWLVVMGQRELAVAGPRPPSQRRRTEKGSRGLADLEFER